ncbi:hypothetical protein EI982_11040 [Haloplanus rallus]|uniref:Uncharacterized protein n=1 Tax=Haloplanus rallus TaxID=1816183 RepID=A0A6B9FEL5_9EURY|nr:MULTISPECIES: hypothetical protein [Haloplanus]QGX95290.1 hypothetical protein EI982_11040 [Haloplanus rallus]
MPDRVASDGDAVTTYRAELARSGGTRRPCLRLPDDVAVDPGEFVRLVLDGDEYHARVDADASGPLLRGAYDNRRLARSDREGTNRLVEWVRGTDLDVGRSVDVDEVTPGHRYGVRVPGRRTVYSVTRRPDDSLTAIAEDLRDE